MVDQRFGRGIVIETAIRVPVSRRRREKTIPGARLRCDCGTIYECSLAKLLLAAGATKSCGCLKVEAALLASRAWKGTHGLGRHSLYQTWYGVIDRCENPSHKSYACYGGRGITVCERWHDVAVFIADIEREIGPRPSGHTLDRWPDNNGNYEPGNVRWATPSQQNANVRRAPEVACSEPGCKRTVKAKGMCDPHYKHSWRSAKRALLTGTAHDIALPVLLVKLV